MIASTIIVAIVNSIRRVPRLRVHGTSLCERKAVLEELVGHVEAADVGVLGRREALSDVEGGGCCACCGAERRVEWTGVEHSQAHVCCLIVAVVGCVDGDTAERSDVVAARGSACEVVGLGVGV